MYLEGIYIFFFCEVRYELFSNEKLTTMWSKLSWSHYREVLSLKNINEIKFYLNECESKNLTQRQLHELIKQKPYNRLSIEVKNKLINKEQLKVNDLIPNPIIIKANSLKEDLTEYALKQLILNNLANSKIYRTDQDGSITVKIKNNRLKIETCSP